MRDFENCLGVWLAAAWAALVVGCGSNPRTSGGDAGTTPDATKPDAPTDAPHHHDATVDAASDGGHEAGHPSGLTLTGTVIELSGKIVAGAALSSGGASATSSSAGTFTMHVPTADARTVLVTKADGYVPLLSVVKVKPGVTAYQVPVVLVPMQVATMPAAAGGQVQTFAAGKPVTVVLAPGAVGTSGNAHLRVAGFDARMGPGTMESVAVDGGTTLQSSGMFYVDVVGDDGGALGYTDGGISFQFDASLPADDSGAGPVFGWVLDPKTGLWSSPQAIGSPAISATQFGYWNADRAVRTACVSGKVVTKGGKTCGGNWVRADGPDGLSSFDYSGSDGSFCVDGAQGYVSYLYVGTTSEPFSMPESAGACTVPASCMDIGMIEVDDCHEQPPTDPCAPGTYCGAEVDGGGVMCADLQTDPYSCGKCFHECFPDQLCVSGMCMTVVEPDGGKHEGGKPDAAIPDTGTSDATSDVTSGCATLVEGSLIPYVETDAAAPVPTGGTLTAGTYTLTSMSGGPCSGAVPTASTITVTPTSSTGGTASFAQSTTGSPGTIFYTPLAGTYTTSGTNLDLSIDCPFTTALPPVPYTATSTTITVALSTLYPACLGVAVYTM